MTRHSTTSALLLSTAIAGTLSPQGSQPRAAPTVARTEYAAIVVQHPKGYTPSAGGDPSYAYWFVDGKMILGGETAWTIARSMGVTMPDSSINTEHSLIVAAGASGWELIDCYSYLAVNIETVTCHLKRPKP